MSKKIIGILICIILVISLASCNSTESDSNEIKVLLVIDKSVSKYEYYSDNIKEAVSEKCKEYNFRMSELYLNINDNSELTKELSGDYDLVIFTSPSLEATAVVEAKTHPYTNFVLLGASADMGLDDIQDVQNIYSIIFEENQMGFLAGVYAASNIEQGKKICIIGINEYMENIEYEVGFKYGVKCVDSSIEVKHYYIKDSTIDTALKEKLVDFMGNNCGFVYFTEQNKTLYDIVNELSIPIIEHKYAQYDNTYCIEENLIDPLKSAIDEFYNGMFQGKIVSVGVSENGYYEMQNGEIISTDTVGAWKNRISESLTAIPKTRSELNTFSPVSF